jgi:hypothetical protein
MSAFNLWSLMLKVKTILERDPLLHNYYNIYLVLVIIHDCFFLFWYFASCCVWYQYLWDIGTVIRNKLLRMTVPISHKYMTVFCVFVNITFGSSCSLNDQQICIIFSNTNVVMTTVYSFFPFIKYRLFEHFYFFLTQNG